MTMLSDRNVLFPTEYNSSGLTGNEENGSLLSELHAFLNIFSLNTYLQTSKETCKMSIFAEEQKTG